MLRKITLCLGVALALSAPAFAQTQEEKTADYIKQQIVDVTSKEAIVNRWKQQFANVKSLAFTSKVDSTLTIEAGNEPVSYTVNFVQDGAKYLNELNFVSGIRPTSYFASAYDGQFYETLIKADEFNVVTKGSKPKEDFNPAGVSNPWQLQYAFVLSDDEVSDLDALRKPDVWEKLLKNIREVTPAERKGQKGSMLTIGSRDSDQIYKVFVDSRMGFPTYWMLSDKDNPARIDSELTADGFCVISQGNQSFTFPLVLNVREAPNDGQAPKIISFVTDIKTLKINQPVAQVFSFPITSKTLVQDTDKPDEK